MLAADFGDAPSPYWTLLLQNGASHEDVGPTLGALRDAEADGLPSSEAEGDGTDDDGIVFGALRAGQAGATLVVNVQNAPTGARLDGWIDFNQDGSWGGPHEQVFDGVQVAQGATTLSFDVPAWAAPGTTFARFRLSTVGHLGVGGAAVDGEVEDYAITIASPNAGLAAFTSSTVSGTSGNLTSAFAADMDGDGDVDLLSAASGSGGVRWYENLFGHQFAVRTVLTSGDARSVFAADVDGDGDMDALSAAGSSINWHENNGLQVFTQRLISSSASTAYSVFAADVDGDGDVDVLSASVSDDKIAWYENNGSQTFTARTISTAADGASGVSAADVDGDGDMDILSASRNDDEIAWYENNGSQTFVAHIIAADADGAHRVSAVDLDGDGDVDVASASATDGEVVWYENDGDQAFTAHLVFTKSGLQDVIAADVDGDGDVDLTAVDLGMVTLLRNNGDQTFASQTVGTGGSSLRGVVAADVDRDGVLDLAQTGSGTNRLVWHRQAAALDYGDAPTGYPTTISENGARHFLAGPTLGANRDADADGTHSAAADADGADDDGVSFSPLQVGLTDAAVMVNIQNAPLGARLDAWIDFNGDGNWGGPGEQIVASAAVVQGDNVLQFAVPATAAAGTTMARFRVSTAGSLGIHGAAVDGEVEDYAVVIASPAAASGVFGPQQVISTTMVQNTTLLPVDMDRDGDIDVVARTTGAGPGIRWFENDGHGQFVGRVVSATATFTPVGVGDVDGDGDMDVVASISSGNLVWYENNGSQAFVSRAVGSAGTMMAPVVVDMDGDGDADILSSMAGYSTSLVWFENNGSQQFTQRSINAGASSAGVAAVDMDGDGDLDLVAAPNVPIGGSTYLRLAWLENNGSQAFTQRTIATTTTNERVQSLAAVDVDGDGDFDVVAGSVSTASSPTSRVAWYENNGSQTFTLRTISVNLASVRSVTAADLDGDGDIDVAAASSSDNRVAWYENDGDQRFGFRTITTAVSSPYSVATADVDGDGDLDVLSASRSDNKLAWYENLPTALGDYGDAPSPYPVTPSAGGPIHTPVGPALGPARDAEIGAANSPQADGDGADDDGVTFGALQVGKFGATVTVNVQNAPAGARLDAWIDFDRDGSWGAAEERIAASVSVVNGDNVLSFDIPAWAQDGPSYARFRLSTAGDLAISGAAADGEVEDHAVTILAPDRGRANFDKRHPLEATSSASTTQTILAVDLDDDGDVDVVAAISGQLIWFEDDGAFNYTRHVIPAAVSPQALAVADMDGDGDLDLLTVGSGVRWLENDGAQNFVVRDVNTSAFSFAVVAADLDADGDMDVTIGTHWFENNGQQSFTSRQIATLASQARSVDAIDVDRDGDLDVVAAVSNQLLWFENRGDRTFFQRTILASTSSSLTTDAVDVDGDGDVDILANVLQSSSNMAWYENDGSQTFTARTITAPPGFSGASKVLGADVDGDGDLDVVANSTAYFTGMRWFENNGAQSFTARTLPVAARTFSAADVDRDGDLDLVASSPSSFGVLAWYEQSDSTIALAVSPPRIPEEGALPLAYTFTRAGNLTTPLTVPFTVGGTAKFGLDYAVAGAASFNATGGTVDFPVGVTQVQVTITPLDDTIIELDETIVLTPLVGPTYAVLGVVGPTGLNTSVTSTITSAEHGADFGDAPAPYRTTLGSGGAVHLDSPGPRLGATRDNEPSGTPSTAADGDGADEDGVVFPVLRVGESRSSVTVNVQAFVPGSLLSAWIDFNGDGSWFGPGEKIAANLAVVDGDNVIAFDVPDSTISGVVYARFRISTQPNLTPIGSVPDGEVEDYAVTVAAPLLSGGTFEAAGAMAESSGGYRKIVATDLDGDGDQDIVAASLAGVEWHENQGGGVLALHVIASKPMGADSVFVVDLDRDGDLDVLAASAAENTIEWFENDGAEAFAGNAITTQDPGVRSVVAADMEGDGDLDMLSASSGDGYVRWYQNDGHESFTQHLAASLAGVQTVIAGDFDRDGDVDVAAGSSTGEADWFAQGTAAFFSKAFDSDQVDVRSLASGDFNGDGLLDLAMASYADGRVVWLENNPAGTFTTHLLDATTAHATSVEAADFDGDGDVDLVAASHSGNRLTWYENKGAGVFTPGPSMAPAANVAALAVGDLDGDGDLDVASAAAALQGGASGPFAISLFENQDSAPMVTVSPASVAEEGSETLVYTFARKGRVGVELTVNFAIGGTAELGVDYTLAGAATLGATSGTVIIPANSMSAQIAVTPIDESVIELPETVVLMVTGGPGYGVIEPSSAVGAIDSGEFGGDFGDAPAPYPTLLTQNGARHREAGPTLGNTRDIEPDGQSSPGASADGADEEGITFGALRVGQLGATLSASVQQAPQGARIDAWIDFNRDGNWGGPGEQILHSAAVSDGLNAFTFDIPNFVAGGVTYARFRISTAGALGVGGQAADGEVEDYAVTIDPPAIGGVVFGPPMMISSDEDLVGSGNVVVADLDGDGDQDFVALGYEDAMWFENNGSANFVRHSLGSMGTQFGASTIEVVDLDGDRDLDIVASGGSTVFNGPGQIRWLENDGNQAFTSRSLLSAPSTITDSQAADVDADGDLDVLYFSYAGDTISWAENDGQQSFTAHHIAMAPGPAFLSVADLDRDGDLDFVATLDDTDQLVWYQNDGVQQFTSRVIDAVAAAGIQSTFAADIDADGDIHVMAAGFNNTIALYRNLGSGSFQRQVLSSSADDAKFVSAVDINGDGRLDVLTASSRDGEVTWFRNDGTGFSERKVTSFAVSALLATPADLDGDGRLDILWWAGFNDGRLAWQKNFATADFGDAPLPFPVTASRNGAAHAPVGPRLGATRTADGDGAPSSNAPDDDGVVIDAVRVGQLRATATVTVTDAPQGARLDAWIDFNGDGNWGGAGEHVAVNVPVVQGVNTIEFDVPSSAKSGAAFGRFRVSTAGGLGPQGGAVDGEVEDHPVSITPPTAASGNFVGHSIGDVGYNTLDAFLVDLDGDGDVDVVSTDVAGAVAWFENQGVQGFSVHTIDPAAFGASSIAAADVDRDGDMDVIAALFSAAPLQWYENDGAQQFTTHIISPPISISGTLRSIWLSDLEGDGDPDIFVAAAQFSSNSGRVTVLPNDGTGQFQSPTSSPTSFHNQSVYTADLDGDGDLDAVGGSEQTDRLSVFLSNGTQLTAENIIAIDANPAVVIAADVDRDGDMDLVTASSELGRIAWYEKILGSYTLRTIASNAIGATDVFAADVDGDGDLDIVTTVSQLNGQIAWYENNGQQSFALRVIDSHLDSGVSVSMADMDGDGDLDVVAISLTQRRLVWYENFPLGDYTGDGAVAGDDFLAWQRSFRAPAAPAGSGADGNRNGVVDSADFTVWATHFATPRVHPVLPPGDFSGDQKVDGADFLEWQRTFGGISVPAGIGADADRNGVIDGDDLEVWQSHLPAFLPLTLSIVQPAVAQSLWAEVDDSARPILHHTVQIASSTTVSRTPVASRRAWEDFSVAPSAHDAALATLTADNVWRWHPLKQSGRQWKKLADYESVGRDGFFTDLGANPLEV